MIQARFSSCKGIITKKQDNMDFIAAKLLVSFNFTCKLLRKRRLYILYHLISCLFLYSRSIDDEFKLNCH